MNIVAGLTLDSLGAATRPLGLYSAALRTACDAAPPPFGKRGYSDMFHAVARNPDWMARSLIVNAEREADGAGRLWSLAASTTDSHMARRVQEHAVDESRHARWYLAILNLTFPGSLDEGLRAQVEETWPKYTLRMVPRAIPGSPFAHQLTIDDLVQMNIAEIRTSINHRLQAPVLMAYAEPMARDRLGQLLSRLLADEVRHIDYSAVLIELLARHTGRDALIDLMTERLREFNEITCQEVERSEFPLHCSRCLVASDGTKVCRDRVEVS